MLRTTMFQVGQLIDDRYRVVRLAGQGGTGEVYEAIDTSNGDRLALKTILPELVDSEKIAERFKREEKYSRAISHPNVLKIHRFFQLPYRNPDMGELVDLPCLVMDFLDGETLADRFQKQRRMSTEEARPIVTQIALALAAAHDAKIVHRDLKPDNIFLVPNEDELHVVLTDFGVARMNRHTDDPLTASNVLLGTPSYMAPEQLELEKALPESDIYALGLIAYEMVTGEFAFEHDVPIQAVFNRVKIKPERPSYHVPDIDPCWDATIMHCLERDPKQRFTDARQIIEALDGKAIAPPPVFEEPVVSSDPETDDDEAQIPARVLIAIGVILLLALVIFFTVNL